MAIGRRHLGNGEYRETLLNEQLRAHLCLSNTRAPSANSLGLVSMKERVRLLDGRIAIQSELGRGTRIEVMMPLSGQLSDPTEQSTESIDLAKPSIADTDNMPPL